MGSYWVTAAIDAVAVIVATVTSLLAASFRRGQLEARVSILEQQREDHITKSDLAFIELRLRNIEQLFELRLRYGQAGP